jgi:Family of unknown function (DUF6308)
VTGQALKALRLDGERPAQARLRFYYDVDGDYAGAAFAQLAPIEPENINATDLYATRLLSVPIGAGATRRFLDEGVARTEVLDALRAIPDKDLLVTDPATLEAMEFFYLAVKTNLSAASRGTRTLGSQQASCAPQATGTVPGARSQGVCLPRPHPKQQLSDRLAGLPSLDRTPGRHHSNRRLVGRDTRECAWETASIGRLTTASA